MLQMDWIEQAPCLYSIGRFDHWVFLALPPDEEANRLRRTAAQIMRHLTSKGWGCALPDLSYYGENPFLNIDNYRIYSEKIWCDVVAALCSNVDRRLRISLRAGACIAPDLPMLGNWRLSPPQSCAVVAARRHKTLRLHREAGTADQRVEGPPVWRWAEPGEDPALTEILTADLTHWMAQCVAS